MEYKFFVVWRSAFTRGLAEYVLEFDQESDAAAFVHYKNKYNPYEPFYYEGE